MVKEFMSTEDRHPVSKNEKNNAQYCGVAAEAASAIRLPGSNRSEIEYMQIVEQGAMANTKKSRSSAGSGRRRSKRKYFPPKAAAEVAVEAEEPAATPSQSASAWKLKKLPSLVGAN